MASSWMGVVNGFAGMRTFQGVLNFKPSCRKNGRVTALKSSSRAHNSTLKLRANTHLYLLQGDSCSFSIYATGYIGRRDSSQGEYECLNLGYKGFLSSSLSLIASFPALGQGQEIIILHTNDLRRVLGANATMVAELRDITDLLLVAGDLFGNPVSSEFEGRAEETSVDFGALTPSSRQS